MTYTPNNLTGELVADIAAELLNSERITFTDGSVLTLTVEHDPFWSIFDDGDWLGSFAAVQQTRWSGYDAPRPEGFDGRARKLHVGRSHDGVWWQPPADIVDTDAINSMRREVLNLLEYGYSIVAVEWTNRVDGKGRPLNDIGYSLGGASESQIGAALEDIIGEVESLDREQRNSTQVEPTWCDAGLHQVDGGGCRQCATEWQTWLGSDNAADAFRTWLTAEHDAQVEYELAAMD